MSRGREAAFPRPYSKEQPGDRVEFAYSQSGMTMREWYAGMALQGILAACAGDNNLLPDKQTAAWAFGYADAMLAESAKGGGK